MMKRSLVILVASLLAVSAQANDNDPKAEVDAYWHALAKTVRDGDATGYRALYHADAVVVMVETGKSHTIDAMMKSWAPGFEATAAGKMKADVEERFGKRIIGETTAWESGIFHYWTIDETGKRADHYAWFESLLVKKDGKWLQTMELQRKTATLDEWEDLAK
jgi:uncharacterized protein (TIGR02246 family)